MTDVLAMPPVSTMPSEETDEPDSAFKILNQDNLPMTVVGEAIFKPFGRDSVKHKPNSLVFPTRRIFAKSDNDLASDLSDSYHNHVKDMSVSHGHLNHCNSATKTRPEASSVPLLNTNFTKVSREIKSHQVFFFMRNGGVDFSTVLNLLVDLKKKQS